MTETEAEYWDQHFTQNEPALGPDGTGFLSQRAARQMGLDEVTINYVYTKAQSENKSPAQIIGDLVRKELATA
jgi:hypothetical protein